MTYTSNFWLRSINYLSICQNHTAISEYQHTQVQQVSYIQYEYFFAILEYVKNFKCASSYATLEVV